MILIYLERVLFNFNQYQYGMIGIAASHGWISLIESTDLSYWAIYSTSGSLFAQFFVEYYYKTLDGFAAKNQTLYSIRQKLEQFRGVAVEKKYSFIDVVVAGYVEVVDVMMMMMIMSTTRDPGLLRGAFMEILKTQRGNGRTDAAPTLPIMPLSSLYELVLRKEGVRIEEGERERIGCGETVRVWGKRSECRL